jgi:hypothetical protein
MLSRIDRSIRDSTSFLLIPSALRLRAEGSNSRVILIMFDLLELHETAP